MPRRLFNHLSFFAFPYQSHSILTLWTPGWVAGDRGNHPFWFCVTSSTLRKLKGFIGGQTTVHDLPFLHKIPRMNNWTFVLHSKILCRSLSHGQEKAVATSFNGYCNHEKKCIQLTKEMKCKILPLGLFPCCEYLYLKFLCFYFSEVESHIIN